MYSVLEEMFVQVQVLKGPQVQPVSVLLKGNLSFASGCFKIVLCVFGFQYFIRNT